MRAVERVAARDRGSIRLLRPQQHWHVNNQEGVQGEQGRWVDARAITERNTARRNIEVSGRP